MTEAVELRALRAADDSPQPGGCARSGPAPIPGDTTPHRTIRDMRRSVLPCLLVLLLAGAGTPPLKRTTAPQFIDRIIAIVGNTPCWRPRSRNSPHGPSQGGKVPDDSAGRLAMRQQMLENMIDEELLVQQATRDTSVRLTEQEIQDQVEKTVQNVRKQFTNDLDFETQLRQAGFGSEEEWRRWLADTQRRTVQLQRLIESLRGKGKLRPIPPTDDQLRDYWNESAAQRPKHPPLVSFRQIVLVVQPDPASVTRARALAESLKVALRATGSRDGKGYSADSSPGPRVVSWGGSVAA